MQRDGKVLPLLAESVNVLGGMRSLGEPRTVSWEAVMALTGCKECGKEVSSKADACPNCGVENPSGSWFNYTGTGCGGGCLGVLGGIVLLGIIVAVFVPEDYSSDTNASPDYSNQLGNEAGQLDRQRRYAPQTINIRSGRGTNNDVVEQISRGDMLYVDSLQKGWWKVYSGPGGGPIGYVSANVVQTSPPPSFEIETWNWRTDPSFGTDGAVIWTAVIRNHTDRYVDNVRVVFTTFDAQGNVLDTEYSYATDIPPGGTSSVKGYVDYFGREERGQIQIKP